MSHEFSQKNQRRRTHFDGSRSHIHARSIRRKLDGAFGKGDFSNPKRNYLAQGTVAEGSYGDGSVAPGVFGES